MPEPDRSIVFLLDCDNTLFDNDALKADLDTQLGALLGVELNRRLWDLYEAVRRETGTVNYPVVLDRFAAICPDLAARDRVRSIIMDYPFASRVYPETPVTLDHLRAIGRPAILSDGDAIYQPLKIERSGLAAEVAGRVLVYIHKEEHLDEVMRRWPAALYVAVDDKAHILAAVKRLLPERFVTVHLLQGHYSADPVPQLPAPDLTLQSIGELRRYHADDLWGLTRRGAS
jgi:FMN phosphatase YigB (HAD superfamily)